MLQFFNKSTATRCFKYLTEVDQRVVVVAVCVTMVVAMLVGTWGPVVYALFFWGTTGQTPGKAVMGIRVVRFDGKPMTLWTSVRRIAGYGLSLAAVGIGFLVILADDRRRGWHDKIAGTCVIYSWKARQNSGLVGRARELFRSA